MPKAHLKCFEPRSKIKNRTSLKSRSSIYRKNRASEVIIHLLFLSLLLWATSADAKSQCPAGTLIIDETTEIVAEGDSLTYGLDASPTGGYPPINSSGLPRSSSPFPEFLEKELGHRVKVVNHGFPGDRSIDGVVRWARSPTRPITLIMYGTNDFGNFGKRISGILSPIEFGKSIEQLVVRRMNDGGQVALLTPPPIKDKVADEQLESYRTTTRDLAAKLNLPLIDTPKILTKVSQKWVDGLHLSVDANLAIARSLSYIFCFGAK